MSPATIFLRVSPQLHERAVKRSVRAGYSLSSWVAYELAKALGVPPSPRSPVRNGAAAPRASSGVIFVRTNPGLRDAINQEANLKGTTVSNVGAEIIAKALKRS